MENKAMLLFHSVFCLFPIHRFFFIANAIFVQGGILFSHPYVPGLVAQLVASQTTDPGPDRVILSWRLITK